MASLIYLLLLMTLSSPFSIFFAESSRKELRNKEIESNSTVKLERSIHFSRIDPSRVVQLSWQPRAFLYKGFLTDEECDHLVSLAQGAKGSVVGGDALRNIAKKRLFGSADVFPNLDDDILRRIEERISAWTFFPKAYGKPLQYYRYALEDATGKFDYLGNKSMSIMTEPLMATVILYLSNVTHGGDILFPESQLNGKIWSDCSKSSNLLKPTKGNAILFFNVHLNASPDKTSTHARCPVVEGEMWCATKFFFVRSIGGGKSTSEWDGNECSDEDESCPKWAAAGECQRNPVYMIGSPDYYGTCRKSCDAC